MANCNNKTSRIISRKFKLRLAINYFVCAKMCRWASAEEDEARENVYEIPTPAHYTIFCRSHQKTVSSMRPNKLRWLTYISARTENAGGAAVESFVLCCSSTSPWNKRQFFSVCIVDYKLNTFKNLCPSIMKSVFSRIVRSAWPE